MRHGVSRTEMNENPDSYGALDRHFWLTRSMARVIGINLSDAMAKKRFSPDDYAVMIARCRAKGCHEACQRWLAAQTSARPTSPPEYCAIADCLVRLSPD